MHDLRRIDTVGVFELEEYEIFERENEEIDIDFKSLEQSIKLENKLKRCFRLEFDIHTPQADIDHEIYRYDEAREGAFYQDIRRIAHSRMRVLTSESAVYEGLFSMVMAEIVDIVEVGNGKIKQREIGHLEALESDELKQLCELYAFYVTRRRKLNIEVSNE
ncbi:hypothetical protein FLK61_39440 [Paenalkalicoccus suaedae]|uniref:Uncharacterized protein n=2 Tax=Paenalkalicoccus suaedae TaxID=2592382 RepID=A0A859FIJ5_9BACI|nr:hypothetical protein FLK61_39440 [Paenalkalicoccus suaedae]